MYYRHDASLPLLQMYISFLKKEEKKGRKVFLHNHNTIIKIAKWTLPQCYYIVLLKLHFASFPNNILYSKRKKKFSSSDLGSSPESCITFSYHLSLGLFIWNNIWGFVCLSQPCHFFKSKGPWFCRMSIKFRFFWCFLMVWFRLCIFVSNTSYVM